MKIVIDGTNYLNKGAELMLEAILEQIKVHHPHASVILNDRHSGIDLRSKRKDVNTFRPWRLRFGHYPWGILQLLRLPSTYFTELYPLKRADILYDASGFRFGDSWNHPDTWLDAYESYLSAIAAQGTRIIFLPQAFGPFHTSAGKRSASILGKYADLIIAREQISLEYLLEAGVQREKTACFSDFTLAVDGVFPSRFETLKNAVCIIPNRKMISHGGLKKEQYLKAVCQLFEYLRQKNEPAYILNHEGKKDLRICREISKTMQVPLITGLNARETKGMIGSARLVITSRYHGLASALNQGIPCIATSWNHKYELLFRDFGMDGTLWEMTSEEVPHAVLDTLLKPEERERIHAKLTEKKQTLVKKNTEMWSLVRNASDRD
ncbi:polysaccharide pyruvyl transferase family protein [Balneolaceae bacterium ANBcel3]|nr:polysaccharide pyruvyl transferase family protein [Balneolaceae bacterium ANBcel3]